MEEMASLWWYQESVDELQQRLLCTRLELESVKMEANEELRKSKEKVTQLIHALNLAYKERDDAKTQYQNLLNKLISTDAISVLHPLKANSSTITDSSTSPSETLNNCPCPVSSPDLLSGADVSAPIITKFSLSNNPPVQLQAPAPAIDPDSLIIDSIVKGRALPQNGMFLKSVLEAGPILQTLLLAGQLPQWRNPPPLQQAFVVPPTVGDRRSFVEMSCGGTASSSQILLSASKSMVNNFGYGRRSCLVGGKWVGAAADGDNNLQINDYNVQMGGGRQRIW